MAIIGSDIQEVLGSAVALNIFCGLEIWIGVLVTIIDSFLFLFIHYQGVRALEAFFAILIGLMAITFWINMIKSQPDMSQLLFGTLVPTIPNRESLTTVIGMFGAVIMPHNLYLHSALVLTRKVDTTRKSMIYEACVYNNIESAVSLFIAFLITMAVIVTFAVYIQQFPEGNKDLDL